MIVGILPCYTTNCSAFNHSKQITWTREREQQSSILSDTILFKIYNNLYTVKTKETYRPTVNFEKLKEFLKRQCL